MTLVSMLWWAVGAAFVIWVGRWLVRVAGWRKPPPRGRHRSVHDAIAAQPLRRFDRRYVPPGSSRSRGDPDDGAIAIDALPVNWSAALEGNSAAGDASCSSSDSGAGSSDGGSCSSSD
jgi:hypothetical protein